MPPKGWSKGVDRTLYRRAENLKRLYGLSLQDYDRMLADQGGVCAICGNTCTRFEYLSVDHDHDTSAVRGLLCHSCNTMLGYAREDISILARAIEYLNEEQNNGNSD